MAKSRNRNNQGGDRPEDIENTTDAEILDQDDQVEDQLIEEEAQEPMANDNDQLQQVETITETDNSTEVEQQTAAYADSPKKKGNNVVWYGVAAVLVAAAVGGIYYSNQDEGKTLTPGTVNQPTAEANPIQEVPADTQGLESNDPPLSETEVPEPSASEAFSTEVGEEESKAKFMGTETTSTAAADESVPADANSDVASAADVVEHQSGAELDTDTAEAPDVASGESVAQESSAADESVPGELGSIVSPEVGIGAFEQEALAKGEKSTEEMTSMDEPNAEMVPASEVEVVESSEPVVSASELSEAEGSIEEPVVASELATDVTAQELPPVANAEETAPVEAVIVESTPTVEAEQLQSANPELIAELEREYEVLNARQQQEIRRLQEELAGMQQHLQDTNTSAENLLLNDVSRLMQSAENELRFNANVPNAVSILTVAQRITAESKNRMLEGLVGAIGADIVALKSSEFATTEDMFRQVQQLALLIDTAPLNTPDYKSHSQLMLPTPTAEGTAGVESTAVDVAPPATDAVDADSKWYERTWTQTKSFASKAYGAVASDLGELVRVEKLSDPNSGLLSSEQAGIMRNNLKMQLSFAQQALMSRQQGVWQTSLMTVEQALAQYFRPDAAETVQAQTMLAELRKASVQPTMPDIAHSRRALSETYEQLRVQRNFQE
ncbi:MAG: uroporphyrinogen-III C-methyltransferase [Alcaligenaceae bacterium]|nr:uroporphyrinogen-III C-methyltransferase [Alcaligenaceae bacterium]